MKVVQTIYLHCKKDPCIDDYIWNSFTSDMSKHEVFGVLAGVQEITFEVPNDFNPIPGQIAVLNQEISLIRAKTEKKIEQVKDQIAALQQLPFLDGAVTTSAPKDPTFSGADNDIPF